MGSPNFVCFESVYDVANIFFNCSAGIILSTSSTTKLECRVLTFNASLCFKYVHSSARIYLYEGWMIPLWALSSDPLQSKNRKSSRYFGVYSYCAKKIEAKPSRHEEGHRDKKDVTSRTRTSWVAISFELFNTHQFQIGALVHYTNTNSTTLHTIFLKIFKLCSKLWFNYISINVDELCRISQLFIKNKIGTLYAILKIEL